MARTRRRATYFEVSTLRDGTVLAAYPVRKPTPHVIKRDRLQIDEDNICKEFSRSGSELGDVRYDGRTRFQDIVANRLNTCRAIRTLVLPRIEQLEAGLAALQSQLNRIEELLANGRSESSA